MKLLQIPEGLRTRALKIADESDDVLIYGETCYGACDLAIHAAKAVGCEKIIHYGHSKFIDSEVPVEYREIREKYDPVPVLKKDIGKIKEKVDAFSKEIEQINSEIEKLKIYCYESREINKNDINMCVGFSRDFDEFDLLEAVLTNNYKKAIQIYNKINLKEDKNEEDKS